MPTCPSGMGIFPFCWVGGLLLMMGINFYITLEGLNYSEILLYHWEGCIREKSWGYHWEGCMWSMQYNVELGYQISICSRAEENHGKLDLVGRSQDLTYADWLLASGPALSTRTLRFVIGLSQRQSYFTTGGLPSISSTWRQAPWDSQPVILFSNWTFAAIVLM
jgi:hypothetical protein